MSCTSTNACITDGIPLAWSVSDVSYVFNQDGFPGMDDATLRAAIGSAFETWERVTCDGNAMPIHLSAAEGETSLGVGPAAEEPNESVILHLSREDWAAYGYDASAFALTSIWFDEEDGSIYGADMHFNGGMDPFGVCPSSGCTSGTTDLLNVATHEAGHFLGLAHSNVPGSTMWCDAQAGETVKRTLAQDDAQGLCSIYPPGVEFVNDDIGQECTFKRSRSCSTHPRRNTCSAGPSGGQPSWSGALLVFGSVMLFTARRRRP